MNYIKNTYQFFLALLALHYFYSYIILYKFLSIYHLQYLPIITIEDITFLFGEINIMIFTMLLSGFIPIWVWFLVSNIVYKSETEGLQQIKEVFIEIKKIVIQLTVKDIKKQIKVKIILLLILIGIGILFYFQFKTTSIDYKLIGFTIVDFFIFPIVYILWKRHRNIIMIGYIVFIIWGGIFFINHIFEIMKTDNKVELVSSGISFEYEGKLIKSDSNYQLFYPGSKCLIMRNSTTQESTLYFMNRIKKIRYYYIEEKK